MVCGYPNISVVAWTLGGEPLTPACVRNVGASAPAGALLDVDAIDGPIVLACGTADTVWPSCHLLDDIVARRDAASVTLAVRGEGASHFVITPPGMPNLDTVSSVGVVSATQLAASEFWDAVAGVLEDARGG
jgi:hypothetical protein